MSSLSRGDRIEGVALDPVHGLSDVAASPGIIGNNSNEKEGFWSTRRVLAAAACALAFHLATSLAFPANGRLSCLGIAGCYAVAALAADRMSRGASGVMRVRWRLLVAGLVFGAMEELLTVYQSAFLDTPDNVAGVQDVAVMLRGLPFLAAVCLTQRELGATFAALDLAQLALAGVLASFGLLYAQPGYLPVSSGTALFWITAANVLIAFLASVRCFGSAHGQERRFFRLVAAFLWVNTLATGAINYYQELHGSIADGSPLHLVCDLPVLALTLVLAGRSQHRGLTAGGTDEPSFVDTLCSLFMPGCSLLLAASIVPGHVRLGLAGVAAGFLLFGVRSTVMLKKSLAAQHELLLANRSMQDQAFSDALTAIPNRRSFDLTLEREWKRAQRSRQPLALLMVDIDHFKDLNDRHGHLVGDRCLREIAGLLRKGLGREADFAARYGGEEFAILLIDTGTEGARIVGESLRRAVELHRCAPDDTTRLAVTISIGVACEVPMLHESSVTLVAAADKALYQAKRSGRNRLEVHAWRMDAVTGPVSTP